MIQAHVTARIPGIKPAHHGIIAKCGEGSKPANAIRDAVKNIFRDTRLKGKRTTDFNGMTLTVTLNKKVDTEEK